MGRTSDSRKRLIDAGHELIWSISYGAVTIDAICDRARVRKGTFYHFFDSKADLIVAAINEWWDERKLIVGQCFSAEVPPLERITRYFEFAVQRQLEIHEESGHILGCPMFTLASEICTQDEKIRFTLQQILALGPLLLGEAVRDAQALGEVPPGNTEIKARLLWAFYEGTLTRARIENDPALLRTLTADALELIGAHPALAPA